MPETMLQQLRELVAHVIEHEHVSPRGAEVLALTMSCVEQLCASGEIDGDESASE